MSLSINRVRGFVAVLAAAVLFVLPIQVSAANANTGTDTSLSAFTVNGVAVIDKQTLALPAGTTEATVVATPTDPNASRVINLDSLLSPGDNPLVVVVTAGDGTTTQTYEVNLDVANSPNDTGATITINGVEYVEGNVSLDALTTSVDVVVTTSDVLATYEITGNNNLLPGRNVLTVEVTAVDLTIATYNINLDVALNTDTSLSTFTVNEAGVIDGEVVDLPSGTESVDVVVETVDADADYVITGNTDLVTGENELKVSVTAADGVTIEEFIVTLNVLESNDTTLATFEVNGEAVEDGSSVELAPLTSEVEVLVETTNIDATYEISGDTDLQAGANYLSVIVTAADGTTAEYNVVLNVALNNDTTIANVLINGQVTAIEEVVELEPFTDLVEVDVETTDPDATFDVVGDTELVAGENILTITVTAADGETVDEYTITLNVLFNNDSTLSLFQIEGIDVEDGSVIDLEPLTTEVAVLVETNDPEATYELAGDAELVPGENTLTLTVTAADESTTEYIVTLNVALNTDVSVFSITVNGNEAVDGETIELEAGTEAVEVEVVTSDPEAVVEVVGDADLVVGENQLVITVTAADESTVGEYVITLNVADNTDTTLAVFEVNGEPVEDGSAITLDPLTTEVSVYVEPTDVNATYEITGDTDLVVGDNELIVTVTAGDGSTTLDYTIILTVPANNDTSADITVNGAPVNDGDVLTYEWGVENVAVEVTLTDLEATFEVSGDSGLVVGENELLVTVIAADGETSRTVTVMINVLANTDTSLATFQVNGADVLGGDVVELEAGTTSVDLNVETTDPEATVEVSGDQELSAGDNDLIISVTAADGQSRFDHVVTLRIAYGTSTELVSFSVNGTDVSYGDELELENGTTDVEVVVETEDADASYTVEGDGGLVTGDNYLVVTVTAADGTTTSEYVVILKVLYGTDTTTSVFQVDGTDVSDGDVVDLPEDTTDVEVLVETTDPEATYEVSGDNDLVIGENVLTVTVTAADGETFEDFYVTLVVPMSTNTELKTFTINGSDVVDGDTFETNGGVTSVDVVVETARTESTFEVVGGTNLVVGENELLVTVTAPDGETTAEYKVTILVPSSDATASVISVDGVETIAGDVVVVENETTSVDVSVETTNEFATATVVGNEDLIEGDNTVTVTVTAQDGTTRDYVFTVRVGGASADTALTTLTLNGADVVDGQTVELRSRTTSVNVVAITRDPAASVKVTGKTGLVVGSNDVVVTVTAPDLKTIRVITIKAVVAPLSTNTNLSTFKVNGLNATDNGTLNLPPLTRVVTVVATPEDAESVVVVSGKSGLVDGNNTLTAVVTSASGAVKTYTVTLNIRALSTDVTLSTFTVNGSAPVNNIVEVAPGTTSVPVVATATSAASSVSISGNTGLRVGDNVVTVLVTAENGATRTYKVTVKVPLSNNTALKSLQINNVETAAGSTVQLGRGTTAVAVKVATVDPNAKFLVTGATALVAGSNTLSVKVTAADGTTVTTYTVTLFVALPSADTGLKSIKVNGSTVSVDGTITVPALTTSVAVETLTTDPEATAVVSGRTGLVGGDNTVTIAVTAASGATKSYTVTVRVIVLSSDTSLKTFTVNTQVYTQSLAVTVPFGTRSVDVVAETTDAGAKFAIVGNGSLKTGANTVTVRVTAANGATKDYSVTVNVAKSTNTDLAILSVNGQNALDGATITVPARTTVASVKAVTADVEASAVVSGTTLVAGVNNTVTVVVTAANGTTTRTVNVTVVVTPLSSDSTLKSLKANNDTYTTGSTVELPIGSKSIAVVAVANDAGASVEVTGNTNLVAGLNNVRVRVTAANGTFTDYTVKAFVASRSTNTAISTVAGTWTINGQDVATEGTVVDLAAGRTAVSASAKPADSKATIAISGTTGLVAGLNTVKFTVTAEDGVTTTEYTRSVRVLVLSSDATAKSITVNSNVYTSGNVEVPFGTRSVDVSAVTNEPAATYAVLGNGALKTGDNTVTVRVTAVNGSTRDYPVAVKVLKSTNTTLAVLSVNGQNALDGATITVPARTTVASVKAVTADVEASAVVSGTTLVAGVNNTVTVVVTAANGTTTRTVNVTVVVTPLSSDSTLKSLKANNDTYTTGSTVELPIGSKSIAVVAVANDAGASVEVTGNTNLVAGLNNVRVRVTAANGTFTDYTVKAFVASRSTNTAISTVAGTWTINGQDVATEGTVVDLAAGRTAVSASAKPADSKATIAISGTTGLVAGLNTVKFTVTAEDGVTTTEYTRSVRVAALSSNANLSSLTVADTSVVSGDTVNVPFGTTRVSVIPVLSSEEAKFTITGNTGMTTGSNSVVVTVTAPSGATVVNTVTVVVAAPASNTGLSTFTINDEAVTNGATINVAAGTTRVRVSAIADDAKASVEVTGKSDLSTGSNTLTVKVTALSGASTTYTVTVNVGN